MLIDSELAESVLRVRRDQLEINRLIGESTFKVPIHLALGHEAVSVSVAKAMQLNDKISLNHRNIHYQLSLGASCNELIEEYKLSEQGIASGKLGSMNLVVPKNRNTYTSNILANNLAVSLGIAFSSVMKNIDSATWVVTGDGAIEEGAFYETLLNAAYLNLSTIIIVENNGWSLGTNIASRRKPIDLGMFANSLGVKYLKLEGNNVEHYFISLQEIRQNLKGPVVVEFIIETLGGYHVNEPSGDRYINYHAGFTKVLANQDMIMSETNMDPIHVLFESNSKGNQNG